MNREFWEAQRDLVTDTSELFGSQQGSNSSRSNSIRMVKILVSSKIIGKALTWTYPYDNGNIYEIPTYDLSLIGTNDSNQAVIKHYEAIRFGVTRSSSSTQSQPYTVGLADKQTHTIKQWIPSYSVHSAPSTEMGAWQVYGNFLVHDGPDDPLTQVYASIGCIEICGGPKGFDKFNDDIIFLTGVNGRNRDEKLRLIGKSKKLIIEYEKAVRPPVKKVTP